MRRPARTITRRQLLRSAGAGAAGPDADGRRSASSWPVRWPRRRRGPRRRPRPRLAHRPDLRIPALTVTRSEPGSSPDPIFIAPYNAPNAPGGRGDRRQQRQPLWENPLAGKVTTNFRVQRYRGSPVLTWWEGSDRTRPRRRRIRDRRHELPHGPSRAGGGGLRGDLHEFVITPRDTRAADQLRGHATPTCRPVGGSRKGTIQDAIFQEIDLATGKLLLEWHSLEHIPLRSPTRR